MTTPYANKNKIHRIAASVGAAIGCLTLAACAGERMNPAESTLLNCVTEEEANYAQLRQVKSSNTPVESLEEVVFTAGNNVFDLHKRTMSTNGVIDLSDTHAVELTANTDRLVLSQPTRNPLLGDVADSVVFTFEGETIDEVNFSALVCNYEGDLYTNVIYSKLEQYVEDTSLLSLEPSPPRISK